MKTLLKNICLLVYAGIFVVGGLMGGTVIGIEVAGLESGREMHEGDAIPPHFPVVAVIANEKGQQELLVARWDVLSKGTFWKSKVVTYLVSQTQGEYAAANDTRAQYRVTAHSADRQTFEVDYRSDIMGILSLHSRYEATKDKISPRYYKMVGQGPVFGAVAAVMIFFYGFLYFLNRKTLTLVSPLMPGWTPKSTSVLSSLAEITAELIWLRAAKPQQQHPPAS